MLQFVRDYFGSQQEPYDETLPETPPGILVTVITSSDIMSRSGAAPFSITLRAVVDGDRPVAVNVLNTILWSGSLALNGSGLTFTDTQTNLEAKRMDIDVLYELSSHLSSSNSYLVEIPPKSAGTKPYEVSFDFHNVHRDNGEHFAGLKIGHEYEIGLGKRDRISWWKIGSEAEVFAAPNQKRSRYLDEDVSKLRMNMTNKATFKVVK